MSYYGGSYSSSPTVQPTGPCPGCNVLLQTYDDDFAYPYVLAQFVIVCLCLGAVCLLTIGQCIFGFRNAHKAVGGRGLYLAALIVTIIYFALNVLALSISETGARVTYSFYVIYALYEFFYEVGIVLIILTLATVGQVPRIARAAIAVLLSLLCLVCFAITIRLVVLQVNEPAHQQIDYEYGGEIINDESYLDLESYWQYIFNILDLVFNAMALVTLFGIAPWMLMRARNVPRIVVTMALVALAALVVYIVFDIAVDAIFLSTNSDSFFDNDNAINFIQVAPDLEYAFLTISLIFLFVLYLVDSRAVKSGKYPQEVQQYSTQYPQPQAGEYQHAGMTTAP